MLTKWLGTRSTHTPKNDRYFRLCLESLEERNAPSGGPGGGNDQGDHDHGHHVPPPPPASVNTSTSVATANNAHGSFNNSTFTNSFNTTITNNITVNLTPGQAMGVQGLLGLTNLLSSSLSNPTLGTLLSDEVAAAVDQYLITLSKLPNSPISSGLASTLSTDLGNIQTAISGLGASPIASMLGTDVYNLTLELLTSAQPTI